MKIHISGHHVEITEGIKQSIENKFAKISKHYPSIMALNSTITVETHQQKVEISTNYEGVNISVKASDKKLYAAIASAAKKLQVALARRKGMLSAKFNEKFIVEQSDQYQLAS
ncbi:ribosomal subunit interface protein [Colwellia sp. 39_35_sub15_T18]|nr:ribosomal subunit interface protein [Colwellia sp. 39_35_sub15_T18]